MYISRPALGAFSKNLQDAVRSGDRVTIKVIKKLHGDNWQISFKGKLLAVKSEVPLTEGRTYRGQVSLFGNAIRFRVQQGEERGAFAERAAKTEIQQKVLQVLKRTGMPASPELVRTIAETAQKMNTKEDIFLKLAVLFLDKGIEVENEEDMTAYPFLVQERRRKGKEKEEHRRESDEENAKKEPLKTKIKKYVKDQIRGVAKGYESPLQIFNHIISSHENWIILPLHIRIDGEEIEGSLRLKMNSPGEKPGAMVLIVRMGGEPLSFAIGDLSAKEPVMKIYAGERLDTAKVRGQMELFSKKLTKLGIKLDDSINNGSLFDGFTEISAEGVKSIDTVI
jgi:hypothetical protein